MKYLSFIARWIFILCLPLLLLSGSIAWAANSLWLYEGGFQKYGITAVTGLEKPELEKAARGLIAYWNSGEELIDITVEKDGVPFTLFNEREVVHLKDVKGLFRLDYGVLLVTLLYALGYAAAGLIRGPDRRRRLARSALIGSAVTLGVMAALGLGTLFNFSGLFLQFHLLSFSNDFWQLDPSRDYLIMLFPQGFWYDVTVYIALAAAGMAVILGGASFFCLRRRVET